MRPLTILATLAAVATLTACGAETTSPPATQPVATTQTPATTGAPPETEPPATTETEEPATTAEEAVEKETPTATIRLENGAPVGGAARIEVTRGDLVTIRIRSDTDEQIHVHGYDLTQSVGPGRPATLTFAAELEGIFDIEAHESGAHVAELVVSP
ncbi:MAG: hypothetical protein KJ051_12485 [Thermoleophilia bacterium]|nr:hypothetical protein [Thermoleophilia bacterium]